MRVIILGAGISGLALAYALCKEHDVVVIEKESRAGGWIETKRIDGFLFEQGPRSLRPKGAGKSTLALIQELGLEKEVVCGAAAAETRYLYYGKKLRTVGRALLPLLPRTAGEFFIKPSSLTDESIESFFTRRFGKTAAERIAGPLTSGIFAGDPKMLSLRSCFPDLYMAEQNHGSVLRSFLSKKKKHEEVSSFERMVRKHSLYSFKNGMETLSEALVCRIRDKIRFNAAVQSVDCSEKKASAALSGGEMVEGDLIVSTLPAAALGSCMRGRYPGLSEMLCSIKAASLAAVNFGYKKLKLPYEGFGYLVPLSEKESVLGVVFDSSAFPEQNSHPEEARLTVMIGGAKQADLLELSEPELIGLSQSALKRHLGIFSPPDAVNFKISRNCVPQYNIGHHEKILTLEQKLSREAPRLKILGSSYCGVSINDCIANALAFAKKELAKLN